MPADPVTGAAADAPVTTGGPLLEVRELCVDHGQLRALFDVSLQVFPARSTR
jgi:hypothetical protein